MCDFNSCHIFIYPLVMTNIAKMTIEIVDFPIKHGDFPYSYVSLPEGIFYLILSYPCTKRIHPALTPLRSRGTNLGSGLSRRHSAATFRSSGGCGGCCRTMYRMICCVGCRLRSFLGVLIVTCVTFQKFTACYECLVLVGQKAWSWSLRLCGVQKWCIPRNGNFNFNIGKDWYGKGVIINKWVLGYPRFYVHHCSSTFR